MSGDPGAEYCWVLDPIDGTVSSSIRGAFIPFVRIQTSRLIVWYRHQRVRMWWLSLGLAHQPLSKESTDRGIDQCARN